MSSESQSIHSELAWRPARGSHFFACSLQCVALPQSSLMSRRPTVVAVHVASTPPTSFYTAAVNALRADTEEPVLVVRSGDDMAAVSAAALHGMAADRMEPTALHVALAAAEYVVMPNTTAARVQRKRPWRIVWSWCADDDDCRELLPRSIADVHVAVRAHHSKGRLLQVRSTLTPAGLWLSLTPPRGLNLRRPAAWRMQDVCILYRLGRFGQRRMLLAQSDGRHALLWPLRWPAHFEQTGWDAAWRSRSNADEKDGRYTNRSLPRLWQGRRAIVLSLTHDGLWHSLFHSLAFSEHTHGIEHGTEHGIEHATEYGTEHAEARPKGEASLWPRLWQSSAAEAVDVDVLPRYTALWPGQDACETCIRTKRRYMCGDCGAQPPVRGWLSLELVLYAQMHSRYWEAVRARTQELVAPDRFHCYAEVFGGPGAFYPRVLSSGPFRNYSELISARPRVLAFRRRIWEHVGLPWTAARDRSTASSASPTVIFVLRRVSRAIVNEAALIRAVAADADLASRVRFVRMEDFGPLTAQLALVAHSSALAGVHGQGLVLVPFLPAHERPCALLELRPKRMSRQSTHAAFDLLRWALMSGVAFHVLKQPDAP